jgi:signal peptidase I
MQFNKEQANQLAPQSGLADFAQSAFPVLLAILILRSFIYEPFRIPSGSMIPTLYVGDFILVEKFRYSLREPVSRTEIVRISEPQRGDVAVFKYPIEADLDYIKRVIGLPGDRITYQDKTFYVQANCFGDCADVPAQVIRKTLLNVGDYQAQRTPLRQYQEQQGDKRYSTLVNPRAVMGDDAYTWDVPAGHYFFVGDNRDNSVDSRHWGFVEENLLVGRAVFVWLSLEFNRDPNSWLPSWIPTKVRFDRLGRIE